MSQAKDATNYSGLKSKELAEFILDCEYDKSINRWTVVEKQLAFALIQAHMIIDSKHGTWANDPQAGELPY